MNTLNARANNRCELCGDEGCEHHGLQVVVSDPRRAWAEALAVVESRCWADPDDEDGWRQAPWLQAARSVFVIKGILLSV